MSTQYDSIGPAYNKMKNRPIDVMYNRYARAAVGDLAGAHVLDLATGTGFFAKKLIEWGAAHAMGFDISSVMVDSAKRELPEAMKDRVEFHVGDCSSPDMLQHAGMSAKAGKFDVVFAGWLLNYAPGPDEMTQMFRNVHRALKPGGRFAAITINPLIIDDFGPGNDLDAAHLGSTYHVIGTNEYGYQIRVTGHVEPENVNFECYFLRADVFQESARAAGFRSLEIQSMLPTGDEIKAQGEEWWAAHLSRPKNSIITASKST